MAALIILSLLIVASCAAQAQEVPAAAPGPGSDAALPPADPCFDQLMTLSDCLTYVEMGSNLTTPDKGCCPALTKLVSSSPQCLCQLLGSNANSSLPIPVDLNKALGLPKACKVETPPVSLCSVINGAPMGSPAASPGPMMPGGGGMAPDMAVSPPGPGNGGRSIRELPFVVVVLGFSSVAVALVF